MKEKMGRFQCEVQWERSVCRRWNASRSVTLKNYSWFCIWETLGCT